MDSVRSHAFKLNEDKHRLKDKLMNGLINGK